MGEGGRGVHLTGPAVLGDGERFAVQALEEGGELGDGLIHSAGDRAVALIQAAVEIRAQPALPVGELGVGGLRAGQRRVLRAVQGHAPDAAREELGIGGADRGAVGVAEVVELFVADRGAQDIEVARRIGLAHVIDETGDLGVRPARGGIGGAPGDRRRPEDVVDLRGRGGLARRGGRGRLFRLLSLLEVLRGHAVGPLLLIVLLAGLLTRGCRIIRVDHLLEVVGGPAGQMSRAADAARIEADEVVGGEHLGGVQGGGGRDHAGAAGARAAGVEEQGAELGRAVGGRQTLESDGEGVARGVVVVERDGRAGALVASPAVRAVAPGEVLVVEGGQPLGDAVRRGRALGRSGRSVGRRLRIRAGRTRRVPRVRCVLRILCVPRVRRARCAHGALAGRQSHGQAENRQNGDETPETNSQE